jgi:hypothetical protein
MVATRFGNQKDITSMRAHALAALAALVAISPAVAQTIPSSPTPPAAPANEQKADMEHLMQYVASPGYIQAISTVILGGEHDISGATCKDPKVLGRSGLLVLSMPHFQSGTDAPVAGSWKDQLKLDRCGTEVVHNVLVQAEADGPHVGLLLPGTTGATVDMQEKGHVVSLALETAMKALACTDPNSAIISNTHPDKVLAEMKADKQGRVTSGKWSEIWDVRACGKPQPVAMTFTIKDDEVGYTAAPAKSKP